MSLSPEASLHSGVFIPDSSLRHLFKSFLLKAPAEPLPKSPEPQHYKWISAQAQKVLIQPVCVCVCV